MTARVDRILDVIDVGLQRAATGHSGEPVAADLCVRCQTRTPVEGTAWCATCRRSAAVTVEQVRDLVDCLAGWARECVKTVGPILADIHKTLVDAGLIGTVTAGRTYTCPRHGPQGTEFCRPCQRKRSS